MQVKEHHRVPTQKDVGSQKVEYCIPEENWNFLQLYLSQSSMISRYYATFPWQQNGLEDLSIQRVKSEFHHFKKCYLLLMFIQWVWAKHKHKNI